MAVRNGKKRLKDHRVLALDIGSRFIKVAELRLASGKVSLLNVAVCPTPPDLIDKSQILDPEGLGLEIRRLLTTNKIRNRKVVVAVRGQSSVVVRPIELQKMNQKELAEAMKFEVERHVPFAANEVVMDYAPFDDPAALPETEENMKILLAVAQEELINAYLKVLKIARLKPIALDVEILSTMRALIDIHEELGSYEKTYALVNMGAASTDICIVNQGNLVFNRSVPIAGDALTNAIVEQLGRTFEEAEELKKEHGQIFFETTAGELPVPHDEEIFGGHGVNDTGSFFSAFAAPEDPQDATIAWGEPTSGALPQQIFSLEDDLAAPSPFAINPGESPSPAPSPTPAPAQPAVPGTPVFSFDDEQHAEPAVFQFGDVEEGQDHAQTPIFSLGGMDDGTDGQSSAPLFKWDNSEDDAHPAPSAPVFNLGEDEDVPPTPAFTHDSDEAMASSPASPSFTADNPSKSPAPVFDLSSELEEQMPQPLSRPSLTTEPEDEMPTPAPVAPVPIDVPPAIIEEISTPALESAPEPAPASELAPAEMVSPTPAVIADRPLGRAPQDVFQRRIFDCMQPTLVELATEIRRSLEYYSSHDPQHPVDRLLLYGGTSRLPQLEEFIRQEIGVDVQQANPFEVIDITPCQLPAEYLQDLAPVLPVCVGLGLRNMLA